ncbi:C4-dicarboxylate ABC transporter substrate-binding protein [Pandoraea terrae]|uniref:C4-dicarboxylate ABC transporter substrate-binding protein n=1 Tax=Pandoraea terrae TaxID=1537710 RepID=A0A5E4TDC3_9BURK|nr:TAXI family TRAP transporter solute-binding subunit [Pandoraea terrae]VVD85915.1 C4-dicarboxylate ABC transporter substrate-binding protein [Pandoraea terrae]
MTSDPRRTPPAHHRLRARFVAISWRDLAVSFGPVVLLSLAAVWLAVWLVQPAPPRHITITAGPEGSSFWNAAQKYRAILARNDITLEVLPSEGSRQNIERLADRKQNVDLGLVQGGVSTGIDVDGLQSLGSVFFAPITVFYRGKTISKLSDLTGKRIAIGREGSGARALSLALLKMNGIEPNGRTTLTAYDGQDAAQALTEGRVDAAMLTGDTATGPTMGKLMRTPGIHLMDFSQADAYTRRFTYLNQLTLPAGVFDLGKNLPPHAVHVISPTVELVARDSLHPALSDLLIEAAKEVHGRAGVLQRAGEFPSSQAHEFPLSDDAKRYYASGKGFLYRHLPFWLASLADRVLVLLVPIIVVLIPAFRLVPSLYAWRVKSRLYRWYGTLIGLEREAMADDAHTAYPELTRRLDATELAVNRLKIPLAYADQFYVLREHIGFVRQRLNAAHAQAEAEQAEAARGIANSNAKTDSPDETAASGGPGSHSTPTARDASAT